MALVVLSGQPCSGKSTVAAALKQLLTTKGLEVIIVDEPSLCLKRNNSYKGGPPHHLHPSCNLLRADSAESKSNSPLLNADSVSEKNTRGSLKSAVERAVSKRHYVILDSLNNIKGYR